MFNQPELLAEPTPNGLHWPEGWESSSMDLFRQKLGQLGRNVGECIQTLGKWLIQFLGTFKIPAYWDIVRSMHSDIQGNKVTHLVPLQ